MRILLLVVAATLWASGSTASGQQAASAPAARLESSTQLMPLPRAEAARRLPIVLQAQRISSQPDLLTLAEGDVEFRRGGLVIRADRLSYDTAGDLANAKGHVRVSRDGAVYSGPELEISVQRFEGYFLQPRFEFLQLGAGGRADRIDFLGNGRSRATNASYTSCPREDGQEPDWVLQTRSVKRLYSVCIE